MRRKVSKCSFNRFLYSRYGRLNRNDRLSRLPESVLHHVVSFLPTTDKKRIRFLSRTWRRIDAQSQTKVCLTGQRLNDPELLRLLGDDFHSVQTLCLKKCSGMKSLNLNNFNLKVIELEHCATLKSVHLNTPNLQVFLYRGRDLRPCEIEFSICKKLVNVILFGVKINNMMFTDCNKTFPFLKLLAVSCFDEQSINISSNSLKTLAFFKFKVSVDINVDAPNLTWFGYNGNILPSSNMKFPLLDEARIELHTNRYTKRGVTWYSKLIKMLECFKHAEKLVFHTNSEKNIVIPKEFRDSFVPPLVKMDLIAVRAFYKTRNFVDLTDGMLWICPRVKNVVFRFNYWFWLKLVHGESTGAVDSSCSFCTAHPLRCWRHSVKQFDLTDEKEESKKKTMSYLKENLKQVERDALDLVALE